MSAICAQNGGWNFKNTDACFLILKLQKMQFLFNLKNVILKIIDIFLSQGCSS